MPDRAEERRGKEGRKAPVVDEGMGRRGRGGMGGNGKRKGGKGRGRPAEGKGKLDPR